ncbi:MAG TPA: adenylate/guanylate cyclase domain-containing protein [Xanthobacteraceae bacterium]
MISIVLLAIVLAGLPLAVWLDLRALSESALRRQADALALVIDQFRDYYTFNVVGRVLSHPGGTVAVPNYQDVPGAIPIPATLSLEIGSKLGESSTTNHMGYRFFSDYPFPPRAFHKFDPFERDTLKLLRDKKESSAYEVSGSILDRRVRLITPIIMGASCVNCHNQTPNSPKRDWMIGDVRGLEEFTVSQPLAANIFAFKYLLIYFVFVAIAGITVVALQRYQSSLISRVNAELGKTNEFLGNVAQKLARYLSPQHYRSIFSGEKDVVVSTERKKLTIFFSDVVNFTSTTERMQPEELTALLNEYLTEMSQIAIKHGGSVNKFIGDAILVFFGDPTTQGVVEDAHACLRMAFEMQRRLAELNVKWRKQGIEQPFRARMGINTGYCNVGNFGSEQRMDYTIIGAEANLAARLQSIAEPGGIVLSYETFVLVSDMVRGRALEPFTLKGIGRPIVPYVVDTAEAVAEGERPVITEHSPGIDLFLDVRAVTSASSERIARVLEAALAAVKSAAAPPSAPVGLQATEAAGRA